MKKQIALALAGTAAAIAGGLRLVQELVEQGDRRQSETGVPDTGTRPEEPKRPTRPSSSEATPKKAPATDQKAGDTPAGKPAKAPVKATKAELYEIATELKISGRSKMSKAELIEAINATSR